MYQEHLEQALNSRPCLRQRWQNYGERGPASILMQGWFLTNLLPRELRTLDSLHQQLVKEVWAAFWQAVPEAEAGYQAFCRDQQRALERLMSAGGSPLIRLQEMLASFLPNLPLSDQQRLAQTILMLVFAPAPESPTAAIRGNRP